MGSFGTLVRRLVSADPGRAGTIASGRGAHAGGFEAVGEALAQGGDVSVACAVVGRELARDGVDLGEALDGLRATTGQVTGREPRFEELRALGHGWAEETLAFVHTLSCEDPLTGLASPAHLRSRLGEVYRGAWEIGESAGRTHVLVVVDGVLPDDVDALDRAWWALSASEDVRRVFRGGETFTRLAPDRLVVLARRTPRLADQLGCLRDLHLARRGPRIWLEPLPPDVEAAAYVLDELVRL